MPNPQPGSFIKIESYKHDRSFHRMWDRTLVVHVSDTVLIGGNDKVKVTESDGREWKTREPALCVFGRGQWFNTIAMIREHGTYFYCNIGSPFSYQKGVLTYIDYDLDIKVFPDGSYDILDREEFAEHRMRMRYPNEVVSRVESEMKTLVSMIENGKGPFQAGFVERWYRRYLTLRNNRWAAKANGSR